MINSIEAVSKPVYGNFGWALDSLKSGQRVARAGWDGKGMWLVLVNHTEASYVAAAGYEVIFDDGSATSQVKNFLPWVGMRTADGGFVPWQASQTDMLAEDWQVV